MIDTFTHTPPVCSFVCIWMVGHTEKVCWVYWFLAWNYMVGFCLHFWESWIVFLFWVNGHIQISLSRWTRCGNPCLCLNIFGPNWKKLRRMLCDCVWSRTELHRNSIFCDIPWPVFFVWFILNLLHVLACCYRDSTFSWLLSVRMSSSEAVKTSVHLQ